MSMQDSGSLFNLYTTSSPHSPSSVGIAYIFKQIVPADAGRRTRSVIIPKINKLIKCVRPSFVKKSPRANEIET